MRKIAFFLAIILAVSLSLTKISAVLQAKSTEIQSPLDFSMENIDGELVDLSEFKGRVVMMVNVASKCGLTPQYKTLQAIYNRYSARGFVVLGLSLIHI